jgi:hypothetical protein
VEAVGVGEIVLVVLMVGQEAAGGIQLRLAQEIHLQHLLPKEIVAELVQPQQILEAVEGVGQAVLVVMAQLLLVATVVLERPHLFLDRQ